MIRYGIVGIGKQGSIYARFLKDNLVDGAILTAVCDIDEERKKWAKENLRDVEIFEDYMDMFKSGLIDVAVINTPHYAHPSIAIDALKSGLHVLSDKPAGVFTIGVKKILEEKEKHPDLSYALIWNQRTNPLYQKAKVIIDKGLLGKTTRIVWIITDWYRSNAYYSQGGWRGTWSGEGGGVLLNQAPHQLDLFTWFMGVPKTVYASCKTIGRQISVENDVTAMMEFENGASGVFITSTHDAPGTNRLEITGEGGKIVIENGKLTFTHNLISEPEFNKTNREFWGVPKTEVLEYSDSLEPIKGYEGNTQHIMIFRNHVNYLLGKEDKLIADGSQGLNALILSNAIYLSEWTGKKIEVPFDERQFLELLVEHMDKEKIEE